ncbi:MAG: AAA family ATPase [Firmicutes bacterium]|nr:AAA family ATPase [Bacillota bacterium]
MFNLVQAHNTVIAMGYQFALEDFLNVLLALETRPFAIFSGPSGAGKTTLTRIIASLFGWHYYMVAVSPAWADPADLLGFMSPLSRQRIAGALEDVLRSRADHALLCLDEFNVAKVEHYFSDFILSDPQFLPCLTGLKPLSPRFGRLGFRHDRGG